MALYADTSVGLPVEMSRCVILPFYIAGRGVECINISSIIIGDTCGGVATRQQVAVVVELTVVVVGMSKVGTVLFFYLLISLFIYLFSSCVGVRVMVVLKTCLFSQY